jgi:hypothetical protein
MIGRELNIATVLPWYLVCMWLCASCCGRGWAKGWRVGVDGGMAGHCG